MRQYLIVSLFVLGLLLAGCPGGGTPQDQVCPEDEQLVCGLDGETYTNPCFAHKAGVNIAHDGPCTSPPSAECSDGDGGKDLFVAGSVLGQDGGYKDDYCKDKNTVVEYYCDGNSVSSMELPCPAGYLCTDGLCDVAPCDDSDDGIKPGEAGTTSSGTEEETDTCEDENTLIEYYCKAGAITSETVDCASNEKCVDGACVEHECEDSDGGQDTSEAGSVTKGEVTQDDACFDPNTVKEYYCEAGLVKSKNIDCAADEQCVEGACVEKETCEDSDGQDKFTQGTTTFESETYMDGCYSEATVLEYYCDGDDVKSKTLVCGIGYECTGGKCVETECEEDDMDETPVRYEIFSDNEATLYEDDLIEVEVGSDKFMLELKSVPNNGSAIFALYASYADYLDNDDICEDEGIDLGQTDQEVCNEDLELDLDVVEDGDKYVEISTGEDFNFVQYYVREGKTYDGSGCEADEEIDQETSNFYPPLSAEMDGKEFKMLGELADIDAVDVSGETLSLEFDGDDYDLEDGDTVDLDGDDYQVDLRFTDSGIDRIVAEPD
ncbi:MAG: hypothetical protein GY852_09580 [bacterium]|nr:hypothetical protein [bacterium]